MSLKKQFICPAYQEFLMCQLHKEYENGEFFYGDNTVPQRSFSSWRGCFLDNLLFSCLEKATTIFGCNLRPYYAYCRVYTKGAILPPHKDVPELEYTITINISQTAMYPIYLQVDGEKQYFHLQPGDALCFQGDRVVHGRDIYDGDLCFQVFLHYVSLHGPHKDKVYNLQNAHDHDYSSHRSIVHRRENTTNFTPALNLASYVKRFCCEEIQPNDINGLFDAKVEEHILPHSKHLYNVGFAKLHLTSCADSTIAQCVNRSLTLYSYLLNLSHDVKDLQPYVMMMKPGGYLNLSWLGTVTGQRMCGILNLSDSETLHLSLCHGDLKVEVPSRNFVAFPNLAMLSGSTIQPVKTNVIALMMW